MSFGFGQPWALLLLVPFAAYVLRLRRRGTPALIYSRAGLLSRNRRRLTEAAARAPGWLRAGSILALILALASPRTGTSAVDIDTEGIAIMLVVDISSSMLAEDFHPRNRLAVAKQAMAEFIRGRAFDRIGMVAFAGEALTQVPITIDYPVIFRAIEQLEVGMLEDGTAIGTAIATAANRLRQAPGESRVMILLTDGENNRGEIDPITAARAAATFDIKVYTIGVGTEGVAPIPVARGLLGGYEYANLPVHIDEELLTEVAKLTGGRYYRATNEAALDSIYHEIDQLEKSTVEVRRYVQYTSRYLPFLVLAALLLVGEWILRASRWGRVP
ncbi:MAG TPA: VWA domain-containing protein [Longimicrobiales bacterium]|nr:VWA domain-containing protein [Longimicrobiales bacterium]